MRRRTRNPIFDQQGYSQALVMGLYISVGKSLRRVVGEAFAKRGESYPLSAIYNNRVLGKAYQEVVEPILEDLTAPDDQEALEDLASLDLEELTAPPAVVTPGPLMDLDEPSDEDLLALEEDDEEDFDLDEDEEDEDDEYEEDEGIPLMDVLVEASGTPRRDLVDYLGLDDSRAEWPQLSDAQLAVLLEGIENGEGISDPQARTTVFANVFLRLLTLDILQPRGEDEPTRIGGAWAKARRASDVEEAAKEVARYALLNAGLQTGGGTLDDVEDAIDAAQDASARATRREGGAPLLPGDLDLEDPAEVVASLQEELRGLAKVDAYTVDPYEETGTLRIVAPEYGVEFSIILVNVRCPEFFDREIEGAVFRVDREPMIMVWAQPQGSEQMGPPTPEACFTMPEEAIMIGSENEGLAARVAGQDVHVYSNIEQVANAMGRYIQTMQEGRMDNPSLPIALAYVVTSGTAFGASLLELVRTMRS